MATKTSMFSGIKGLLRSRPRWHTEAGLVRLDITSGGMAGWQWVGHLEEAHVSVAPSAASVLVSPDFVCAEKGVKYAVAILPGRLFSARKNRTATNIQAEADRRGLIKPNTDLACLIRRSFSDEDIQAMGFRSIIVMHEPILADGSLCVLGVDSDGASDGPFWATYELGTYSYDDPPDDPWDREHGFAYIVPV